MNFVNKKIQSYTGDALSGTLDKVQRKRKQQQPQQTSSLHDSQVVVDETQVKFSSANNSNLGITTPPRYSTNKLTSNVYDPNAGFAFGGDSKPIGPPPPPIGFRRDLLDPQQINVLPTAPPDETGPAKQPVDPRENLGDSSESLYQGDAWNRVWFQRVMLLSLVKLFIFIRKIYEDFHATKLYRVSGKTGHFMIAATTLVLPTIIFTIYRVSRYLQVALASPNPAALQVMPQSRLGDRDASKTPSEDDAQLRKALITSPIGAPTSSHKQAQAEEDGLVTARQTPTQNVDEFHDSRSQQEQTLGASPSPAPSTAIVKDSPPQATKIDSDFKERVKIDKLGNIPDKRTARIAIGASEQVLHGVMFIFWQLKRQVDMLGYLIERSCLWRKPKESEQEEFDRLRTGSDGLEWFQGFYSAFLAILIQVYTLGVVWASKDGEEFKAFQATHISTVGGADLGAAISGPGSDGIVAKAGQSLSTAISQQALSGTLIRGKDLLIISELVVSAALISSLLVAVKRLDDGPLTLTLSILGWGSLFAARVVILALSYVHIGWPIMLPATLCHILGITAWIYKISLASHNDDPSESDESKWDDQIGGYEINDAERGQSMELRQGESPQKSNVSIAQSASNTSRWTPLQHTVLLSQIVNLFAIPSLFYWPIMFNLKLHFRPFKYLVLILSENFILIPTIWYLIGEQSITPGQAYLLGAVGGLSVFGVLTIYMYVCCKPDLTEYFARADELFNEAERSGIYYEFCSRVFKLPDLSKRSFRRLMEQVEVIEEIEEK